MDTPFNLTSYTNELIQNQQARSVGDVLQNDPSVRVARGFGNFRSRTFDPRLRPRLGRRRLQRALQPSAPAIYFARVFERVEAAAGAELFPDRLPPIGDDRRLDQPVAQARRTSR